MTDWKTVAESIWNEILQEIRNLRENDKTLEEIAKILGVRHRALIGEWLRGNKRAENASFSNLMTYAESLGVDYRSFFPAEDGSCGNQRELIARMKKELEDLRRQVRDLQVYRNKWEGHLETMAAQAGAMVKKTAS